MTPRTTEADWPDPEPRFVGTETGAGDSDSAGAGRLGRRAARGGLFTAAGTWIRFVVQLGTAIVAARMLGPAGVGTVAVLLVVVGGVAEVIRNGGVAVVITRHAPLTAAQLSALHRTSSITGGIVGALVAGAGFLTAVLVDDERYVVFFLVAAVGPACAGLAAVPAALLARNLRFRALATAEVIAVVAGAAGAVFLVVLGAGPVALVLQTSALWVGSTVIVLAVCPWRPTRSASFAAIRAHVVTAAEFTLVQLFGLTTGNVDRFVVGVVRGTAAAGLYTQASQLMLLPLQQVSGPLERIAVPFLARAKGSADRFVAGYRVFVGVLAYVLWPTYAVLGVLAAPVVVLLFGPRWIEAAAPLRLLAVAGAVHALGYVSTWLFAVAGRSRAQLVWELATRPLIVVGVVVGAQGGAVGVALASTVGTVLALVPRFLVSGRGTPIGLRALVAPLVGPLVVALAAAAGASLVPVALRPAAGLMTASSTTLVSGGPIVVVAHLAVGLLGAAIAAALAAVVVPFVRRDVRSLAGRVRRVLRPADAPAATPAAAPAAD